MGPRQCRASVGRSGPPANSRQFKVALAATNARGDDVQADVGGCRGCAPPAPADVGQTGAARRPEALSRTRTHHPQEPRRSNRSACSTVRTSRSSSSTGPTCQRTRMSRHRPPPRRSEPETIQPITSACPCPPARSRASLPAMTQPCCSMRSRCTIPRSMRRSSCMWEPAPTCR